MYRVIRPVFAALLVGAATASAAHAATVHVDLSGYVNALGNRSGLPQGTTTAGNTGNSFAAQEFTLLPTSANNIWLGATTGDSVDIAVNIQNATTAYTLMNTGYGQNGLLTATVTFKATGGVSQSFDLYGNSDIRDFNNYVWTNSINGTTTQEWYTTNSTPTTNDQTHRYDAQQFALSSAFLGQTLTDILITAGSAGSNYSQPFLVAANVQTAAVAATPLPGALPLFVSGLGALSVMSWRKKRKAQAAAA